VFGSNDFQFPPSLLESFRNSLKESNLDFDLRVYDDVGHAFWSDMESVRRGDQPQADAYAQVTQFLQKHFATFG